MAPDGLQNEPRASFHDPLHVSDAAAALRDVAGAVTS